MNTSGLSFRGEYLIFDNYFGPSTVSTVENKNGRTIIIRARNYEKWHVYE